MKRIALFIISLLSLTLISPVSAASDPNLYFDDAIFDYYLEKTDTGTKMKVKETLKAVFSNNSTSHGPIRIIPFTNQNGNNITIDELNITATRNGASEPIAKIEKVDNYYQVNIGTASKTIQGEQTYVLEYEFKNVITEYDASGKDTSGSGGDHQELYWDTNGTGWPNAFNSITANVHFASNYPAKEPAYCYTGTKGSTDRDCTITKTSDGFTFKTTRKLNAYENMTFDIEFPAGTFLVPTYNNYILVITTSVVGAIAFLMVFFSIRSYFKKARENRAYAKGLFAAPQYLPMANLTVAEAGEIYLGKTKPTETASLLELAIAHKIQLISEQSTTKVLGKEKTTWKVKVEDTQNLAYHQEKLLRIINGGPMPKAGEIIEVKKYPATSTLAELSKGYSTSAREEAKQKGFLIGNKTFKNSLIPFLILLIIIVCGLFLPIATIFIDDPKNLNFYGHIVGSPYLIYLSIGIFIVAFIFTAALNIQTSKYKNCTKEGLDVSNYLDGLKLYISMAEAERLEFNQSAKNAPKDATGLVKLYEKLLPYACLFGLEETWLKELQKCYENLDYTPNWYSGSDHLNYYMFSNMIHTTSSTIASSTAWHDSSSSSGFSGSGGGGFSGGGGGGGGGGSW